LISFSHYVHSLTKELSIIAGPASPDLASKIAKQLGAELIPVEVQIFTDGESKIRMDRVENKHCIIVQSTYPPTDRHIIQTLMMIKKCRDDGAADVCTVIPYMAYARQDRSFLHGEVVSIELIAHLLEATGINRMLTIDIHNVNALSYFKTDIKNISAIPPLASYARRNMKLNKPIVISPDIGGMGRAEQFAHMLGTEMICLKKYRDRKTGEVHITATNLSSLIIGRDVIIIDDMVSSGMSIIKACELLKKNKCGKIYVMCTHALLLKGAKERIRLAGVQDIIATNSIPSEFARVDLSFDVSSALNSLANTYS
jgi:ribose-phosphate pyrophosphokinase